MKDNNNNERHNKKTGRFETVFCRCRTFFLVGILVPVVFVAIKHRKVIIELDSSTTHEALFDIDLPQIAKQIPLYKPVAMESSQGNAAANNNVTNTNAESGETIIHAQEPFTETSQTKVTQHSVSQTIPEKETTINAVGSSSLHPVIAWREGKIKSDQFLPDKIPVVVWPYCEFALKSSESIHTQQNGIRESAYLELEMNMLSLQRDIVWVGDILYPFAPLAKWCDEFAKRVLVAKEFRAQHGLLEPWPIFLVDFADGPGARRCKNIERLMGEDYVFNFVRGMVWSRRWVKDRQWVQIGSFRPNQSHKLLELPVRTDIVEETNRVLQTQYNLTLQDSIEKDSRPIDMAHFWPIIDPAKGASQSNLRYRVSNIMNGIQQQENLTAFIGTAGTRESVGRKTAQTEYIEKMLESKIVIVTQKDAWEGHYRLFEALVSGAMVMTDHILDKPPGLVAGKSIVEFSNAQDLESKILYYLSHPKERQQIARNGRFMAMNQHRTWHRIEEIIFGQPMTTCQSNRTNNNNANKQCPWMVHANSDDSSHSPIAEHSLSSKAKNIQNVFWSFFPFADFGPRGLNSLLFKAMFFHFCPRAMETHPVISQGGVPTSHFSEDLIVKNFPPKDYCRVQILNLPRLVPKPYVAARSKNEQPFTTFSTISDPLDRLIKSFVDDDDIFRLGKIKQNATIEEFVKDPRIPNCQTKMLLGHDCFDRVEEKKLNISLAMERIQSDGFFFGITNRWYETICLFHKWYGGSIQIHELHDNWPLEPLKLKQNIANFEDLDTVLYRHAVDVFEKRLEQVDCLMYRESSVPIVPSSSRLLNNNHQSVAISKITGSNNDSRKDNRNENHDNDEEASDSAVATDDDTTATVMGMATGYPLDVYQKFVGSLRRSGFKGHIILGVAPDIPRDVKKYLTSRKVTMKKLSYMNCTYEPVLDRKQKQNPSGATKELLTCAYPYPDIKIRWSRFPLQRDWLLECETCTGPVLTIDVRDSVFQRNPFGKGSPKVEGLQLFEESPERKTTHWLVFGPLSKCKGVKYNEVMLCSGSTIGTRVAILDYFDKMYNEMKEWISNPKCRFTMNGDDQTIHNYLYYSGKFGPTAKAIPNRYGIVNTVGVDCAHILENHKNNLVGKGRERGDGNRIPFPGAHGKDWLGNVSWVKRKEQGRDFTISYSLTNADGFLINADNTISRVIHQYDRCGVQMSQWLGKQDFYRDGK